MHKFTYTFLILAMSSCLQVQDKAQPSPAPQAPPAEEQSEIVPLAGDFDLIPEKEINRYRLRLRPGMRFVRNGESSDSELVFQGGEQVAGVITNGSAEKPIRVEVPQDLYLVESLEPKDFDQGLVLPHPKANGEFIIATTGRLRLAPGVRLKIGHRKLTLMAETLEFEDNKIFSFEPSDLPSGQALPGGVLTLHAKGAKGRVHISLPGQRGKNGANGAPIPGRAPQGENRKELTEEFSVGGLLGSRWSGVCAKATGGTGAPGAKGNAGESGGKGGAGGRLQLAISKADRLQINLTVLGGAGGAAGLGGPGQQGGLPGSSGKAKITTYSSFPNRIGYSQALGTTFRDCPTGAEGAAGPMGDSGQPGQAGAPGQYCVADGDKWNCRSHGSTIQ